MTDTCTHKSRHKFVATNKSTDIQTVLFEGKLEVEYDKKAQHSYITCPFGYENVVHQHLDGTEIVFQWYEIDTEGQETPCPGPNWTKLENNCFGRLIK